MQALGVDELFTGDILQVADLSNAAPADANVGARHPIGQHTFSSTNN
jgi:hypothetical protein